MITLNSVKPRDKLSKKSDKDAEHIMFKYEYIDKVLNSTEMLQRCPSYLGQRQKNHNIELVKTTMAILLQGLLTLEEIHLLIDCFQTQCTKNAQDFKLGKLKGDYSAGRYTCMENLGQSLPLNLE